MAPPKTNKHCHGSQYVHQSLQSPDNGIMKRLAQVLDMNDSPPKQARPRFRPHPIFFYGSAASHQI